ncbi:MAG: hypothetical protein IIB81_01800 [Nanoarchaeota archaeon]|nr:hypothetical protein [Nanoarchaeota archaeon]
MNQAANATEAARLIIKLIKGRSKRLRQGHPWVFSNEALAASPLNAKK